MSDDNAQTCTNVYEYSVRANLGDALTFIPLGIHYAFEASKSGYHLKQVGPLHFLVENSIKFLYAYILKKLVLLVVFTFLGIYFLGVSVFVHCLRNTPLTPAQAEELASGESEEVISRLHVFSSAGTVSLLSGQPSSGEIKLQKRKSGTCISRICPSEGWYRGLQGVGLCGTPRHSPDFASLFPFA
ncbi:hypothetical protein MKW98_019591 [Papaver atlanticum]|uniref:Uncharacterized protein n=1 Tax=Papaver atlanticum TaxID=357466 RepID=A0AAD4XB77_9MAGN|nr:hypothetical protein MKW98_019591 [Papaver atlanticum]